MLRMPSKASAQKVVSEGNVTQWHHTTLHTNTNFPSRTSKQIYHLKTKQNRLDFTH